jgi:hypothetical protein
MGEYGTNKHINNVVKTPFYNKKENMHGKMMINIVAPVLFIYED